MSTTLTRSRAATSNALEQARDHFRIDTPDHTMQVLRDDGLYRHLRFRRAGFEFRCYEVEYVSEPSMFFQFDLVTWPGYLAISGDIGDYMFCRLPDMIEFFSAQGGYVNYDYWAEKLVAPVGRRSVRVFSEDRYRQLVEAWIADRQDTDEPDEELPAAAREQLLEPLEEYLLDLRSAQELLRDFEHNGVVISDAWDWDLTDYDHRYLYCCCAIAWGVGEYLKATAR